jgi:sorting nexin-9/18/33
MKRKAQLELWLNRLSSHPVISESEVFIHFLQCDDTSSKWKAGKRKAEKDEYRGAQWFCKHFFFNKNYFFTFYITFEIK